MKILYAILILFALYVLIVFVRFKYTLASAHLPNFIQEEKTFGQGSVLTYVAAGDSTAAGVGASSFERSYTYRVAEYLSKSYTVTYKNVGVSGARTNDVIEKQLNAIIQANPDVITLSIGANDTTHLQNRKVIIENVKTILEALTSKTHAQIYVTTVPIVDRAPLLPYPFLKLLAHRINKTNPEILRLENERVHIVDIHEYGWDQYPDIKTTFAKDQFHPNDEGYNNWTNAFLNRIKTHFH
jgi:lysophospholipase L1-like esterase